MLIKRIYFYYLQHIFILTQVSSLLKIYVVSILLNQEIFRIMLDSYSTSIVFLGFFHFFAFFLRSASFVTESLPLESPLV
jgi:hypothetical protein